MGTTVETLAPPIAQVQEWLIYPRVETVSEGFEFVHADGTVYHAENAESARAACPVLGKMAIEQSDLLLEVAALGQQKMKEERVKESPKQIEPEPINNHQKPEPRPKAMHELKTTKPEQSKVNPKSDTVKSKLTIEQPQVLDDLRQEQLGKDKDVNQLPNTNPLVVERIMASKLKIKNEYHAEPRQAMMTETQDFRVPRPIEQQRSEAFIRYQSIVNENKLPIALRHAGWQVNIRANTVAVETIPFGDSAIYKHDLPESTADTTTELTQQFIRSTNVESMGDSCESTFVSEEVRQTDELNLEAPTQPLLEKVESDADNYLPQNEEINVIELNVVTDEGLALRFEPEVIDTYVELLAFIKEQVETEPTETVEVVETAAIDTPTLELEVVAHDEAIQDFEAFITAQTKPEEPTSLETIIGHVDKQPLEQMLVQLVQYLEEAQAEDNDGNGIHVEDTPEDISERNVRTVLQDITDILPTCYGVYDETLEKRLQLTSELTQKLLALIRCLGYEYPREVLVEFVRLYGLTCLLQALQLTIQKHTGYNPEFVAQRAYSLQTDDNSTKTKLIKAISRLALYCRYQELNLVATDWDTRRGISPETMDAICN